MFDIIKKKRKYRRRKKQVKRFFSPFLLFIIIILSIVIVSEKTSQEPEVEYKTEEKKIEQEKTIKTEDSIIENIIEKIKEDEEIKINEPQDISISGKQATFSDFFSSLAWIDNNKTDMYFDRNSTNLTFPRDIRVNQIDARSIFSAFMPSVIASGEGESLILGKSRITKNNEIYLWNFQQNQTLPKEHNWGKTGISNISDIIKADSLHNKGAGILGDWMVFFADSKEQALKSINVVFLDGNLKIVSKKSLGDFSINTQIKCGKEDCLIYDPLEMRFWRFDIGPQNLFPLPVLSNKIIEQSPDQVDFSALKMTSLSNSNNDWMIGTGKGKKIILFKSTWEQDTQAIEKVFEKETEYNGKLSMFTKSNGSVFVLWSGYFAQAYEINPDNNVKDLTDKFGWRILTGEDVKIYEHNKFLYIINNNNSLIRFDGNINIGLDDKIGLEYSPSFFEIIFSGKQAGQEAFLISKVPGSGTKIYSVFDYGFDFSKSKQITSTKINFNVRKINGARIDNLDFNAKNSNISYFLSNNGGQTWTKTELGKKTKINTTGNDLRWKIEITPNEEINLTQPLYIRSITFTYWYEK